MDYSQYDTVIVAFSGGKDSWACLLHIIEGGCPKEKIELWHHEIDGREGSALMDWPCTTSYVRACAESMGIPVYFSWKVGGFEREMTRCDEKTARTAFEVPTQDGGVAVHYAGGTRGKDATRCMFPQVSANLSVRWCSAYLKIDVCSMAIRNQDRFNHSRTLLVTGERAEESAARAKYNDFEMDRADNRDGRTHRRVDRWRPVHKWREDDVWQAMKRHSINPHPAYHLGWGRVSCMNCIFGSANQWASVRKISPMAFDEIAAYEDLFDKTIHRTRSVIELADSGEPYPMLADDIRDALNPQWDKDIFVAGAWTLPTGAFGESCGPT